MQSARQTVSSSSGPTISKMVGLRLAVSVRKRTPRHGGLNDPGGGAWGRHAGAPRRSPYQRSLSLIALHRSPGTASFR